MFGFSFYVVVRHVMDSLANLYYSGPALEPFLIQREKGEHKILDL